MIVYTKHNNKTYFVKIISNVSARFWNIFLPRDQVLEKNSAIVKHSFSGIKPLLIPNQLIIRFGPLSFYLCSIVIIKILMTSSITHHTFRVREARPQAHCLAKGQDAVEIIIRVCIVYCIILFWKLNSESTYSLGKYCWSKSSCI